MVDVSDETKPVWVVTGMSGAGKATALASFESLGFRCIDNLPPSLLEQLDATGSAGLAVVVDTRQVGDTAVLPARLGRRVLFLDAADDVLAQRLSESTRPHPLAAAGSTPAAIAAERLAMQVMRAAADVVVDTSALTPDRLHERLVEVVGPLRESATSTMVCTVSSFGFKYGPQIEADWVIDARFLRNPFWDPALRPLTGNDAPVVEYIFAEPPAPEFVERLAEMLGWTVAQAEARGRTRLHVAVGCTGGRHRSVAVANALADRLRMLGVGVVLRHRDVERPDPR